MQGFRFRTVPSIIAEPGSSAHIGELVRDTGAASVLVVTDPGIRHLGLLDGALSAIVDAGIEASLFAEVEADPSDATVLKSVGQARAEGVGAVVGFGGGSSMDVAKLVAFLAVSDQPLNEAFGVGNARGSRLPLIQVPTTAGTGSEVSPVSVVTTGDTEKMGVVSPILYADIAVLDADLTLGLPQHVTAATGIDAMVHALEAYTCMSWIGVGYRISAPSG